MKAIIKRVLITGGFGFIGSNLIRVLKSNKRKYDIVVFERTKTNQEELKFIKGDITNKEDIEKAVSETKPDYIIHLAAILRAKTAEERQMMFDVNILGTLNLLEACKNHKPEHVILLGSGDEYGDIKVPFRESDQPNPLSCYAISKLTANSYGLWYYNYHNIPVTVVRPSIVYGKGSSSRLFNDIIEAEKKCKEVHTSKGDQTRDYIHVDDLTDAVKFILGKKKAVGEIYNVASGEAIKIIDVINKIHNAMGRRAKIFNDLKYSDNVMEYEMELSKIKKLGWSPRIKLNEGIKKLFSKK